MNPTIFVSLILTLGALYLFIGWRAAQQVHTLKDYFLAGRSLGPIQLAIALVATQLGGGAILGSSQQSFSIGLYGLLYVASISIGLLILACGLAGRMRRLSVSTMPEIFERSYHSSALRRTASLLSIISLVGIMAAQVVASRNLMVSLGVYNEALFLVFWASVIIYTALGGLRAVVDNDIYQLTFIITVFCTLFGLELISAPAAIWATLITGGARFAAPEVLNFSKITALIIVPAAYVLIEQDMAQNIFAARSPRVAVLGSLLAALFMIGFSIIPVFYGMKANLLDIAVPCDGNPLVCLFDQLYSPFVVTFVVYGVFAAIISTADALLCAISSHVVQDFTEDHSRSKLLLSKVTTLVVGCITLIIGRIYSNVLDLILASTNMAVVGLLVPLLVAYLAPTRCSRLGAWLALGSGLGTLLILTHTTIAATPSPEATALLASMVAYCIGYGVEKIGKIKVA